MSILRTGGTELLGVVERRVGCSDQTVFGNVRISAHISTEEDMEEPGHWTITWSVVEVDITS